ncbi:MAG: hypothetical protein EBU81_12855, partial [Proteobacteria bacterium]|nr:hypothetical protein [Pseudomonadota bacterium]
MKRRQFLSFLPLAAGAISWGCRRKLRPELIKIEDFEDRKGGWRVIKVACVGDSITYGAGVEEREKNNYPKQLGELLGNRFEVRNFGRSGATLSRVGDLPYATTDEFKAALAWQPDMVILKLGTNKNEFKRALEREMMSCKDAYTRAFANGFYAEKNGCIGRISTISGGGLIVLVDKNDHKYFHKGQTLN